MSNEKPWLNTKVVLSALGVLTILATVLLNLVGDSKPPVTNVVSEKSHSDHVEDYTGFKEWNSNLHNDHSDRFIMNESRLNYLEKELSRQQGAQEAIRRYEDSRSTHHGANSAFSREWYEPQKIWIITENTTNKKYWENKEGNRFVLSWTVDNNVRKYFYKDRNNNNKNTWPD